jgi:hypothetical protein
MGSSRVWVDLVASPAGIATLEKGVGETRAFASAQIVNTGDGTCPYATIQPEPAPAARATASDEEIGATATWSGKPGTTTGVLQVTLDASASNPIAIGAPAADAIIDLFIDYRDGVPVSYRASGSHDGFPAYEIYLNGSLVYSHDSNALGQTPLSLFPPMEFPVDIKATAIPARP